MGRPGPHPAAVARTTDEARRGRTPGEWAAIRDPESARRQIAEALAAGGEERERAAHRGFESAYEAWSRCDWELNTLFLDGEGFLFRSADILQNLPDARDQYPGVEGYLEAQELLLEGWSDLQLSLEDVAACDERNITTLFRWRGRGRRSGAAVDQLGVCHHEFHDGLVVEQVFWMDHVAALEALGLEPSRRHG